jgi:hypothetical protein
MAKTVSSHIEALILRGEELLPLGGGLFGGYNGELQANYLAWRHEAIEAIRRLGGPAAHVVRKIERDKHGEFFYRTSVESVLRSLRETLELAREMATWS